MGRELFIYWKVQAALLARALKAGHALQAALRQRHPSLQARLLQRADTSDVVTLMEVYAQPGGVTEEVRLEIEMLAALHLAPLGAQLPPRHVEVFEARAAGR